MATTLSSDGSFSTRPPKCYVQDLVTLEKVEAQFNPVKLERIIQVEWARLTIPGLSHRPLQYNFTDNSKMQVELVYDAQLPGCTVPQLLHTANFFESICYTKRGAQNVAGGQPSRVLFKWPTLLSLTCVVGGGLKISYERFNKEGTPTFLRLTVPLEEIRDTRLFSEDALTSGGQRSPSPTQPAAAQAGDIVGGGVA